MCDESLAALRLAVLFLLLCQLFSDVDALNVEGLALISFKNSVNGDSTDVLKDWNSWDDNPCSWNGVTCDNGKVVILSLANKRLSGVLHPALGNLSALRHVNLHDNSFFGSLPVELFNVEGLQSLILSGNSFSGPLPSQLGNLKRLRTLDLSQNSLNGSIPSSVLLCGGLKTFVLSQNNLTGSIPYGLGTKIVNLQRLSLSFNMLTGSIPDDMGNLSSLQGTLDLSHNFFTGSIPPNLGNLPEKLYIDLSYNNLSGQIPQFGVLQNLGPTAYIGNSMLCGLPLNNNCFSIPIDPTQPALQHPSPAKAGHPFSVIALLAGVVVGVCLIGILASCWYREVSACRGRENKTPCSFKDALMVRKEFFCLARHELKRVAENMEYNFVLMDLQANFDLEQLLKASAYLLGKSGSGIVYKVVLEDGKSFVVRRLGDGGRQRFKEFQTEAEAIGKVRHPNVVALLGYCWSADEQLLIYDYIPNGDLATAIHGKTGVASISPLSWSDRLKIMRGIAKGLVYLHDCSPKKYVHGDLKAGKILLEQNMEPRISDFGLGRLAKVAGDVTTSLTETTVTGTPPQMSPIRATQIGSPLTKESYYRAPEATATSKPSQKWDVFSYGVILLEMISGKLPAIQADSSEIELVRWIQQCVSERKRLLSFMDPSVAQDVDEEEAEAVIKVALACVQNNPDSRPSMRVVSACLDILAK